MMQKLFVFDFDGTLVNTSELLSIGIPEYAIEHNMKIPNIEKIRQNYADPYNVDFEWGIELKDQYYHLDQAFILISQKISAGIYKPTLYNNVRTILEYLAQKNYKMAICTAREKHAVENVLKNYGLLEYFTIFKTQEDVKERGKKAKPYPDLLMEIMEESNCDFENTMMIGDTDSDIKMAKSCNVRNVALTWGGYQPRERLVENNPDYLFDDIIDLLQII